MWLLISNLLRIRTFSIVEKRKNKLAHATFWRRKTVSVFRLEYLLMLKNCFDCRKIYSLNFRVFSETL